VLISAKLKVSRENQKEATVSNDLFNPYVCGEARDGLGNLLKFTCRPGDEAMIRDFLATKVRTISRVSSERMIGRFTRFDAEQHAYAGGGCGYVEVLEIKDAPDGRCGIVISYCGPGFESFSEWESLPDAMAAFKKLRWSGRQKREDDFEGLAGFKRFVNCGELTPWFYALGEQALVGDYVFPGTLQDDPVYRIGRKFVVRDRRDKNAIPRIKTCLGTSSKKNYRVIYWDDGTSACYYQGDMMPRPLHEKELWITEAMQKFQEMLAGRSTTFSIDLLDGTVFTGKIKVSKKSASVAGRYEMSISTDKGSFEGYHDFTPSAEHPDVVRYCKECYEKAGYEVHAISAKLKEKETGSKKWSGVFLS
jgi:hypothetical protein